MKRWIIMLTCLSAIGVFSACDPVRMNASWTDTQAQQVKFTKILVMAIGKDMAKRKLGEDAVAGELSRHGFSAATSLDELGPDFAGRKDSASMQRTLLDKGVDGVVTIRVLDVNEYDRWAPAGVYYPPGGFYRGFSGYYYRVWGYYGNPGYRVTDVEVLLESNLYEVLTGRLLWSGQSRAFTRDPSAGMAARYARNIVADMMNKKVLIH